MDIINNVKIIIDDLVKKGVEYAISLYVFFDSPSNCEYENIIDTLKHAFGEDNAKKVYQQISEEFKRKGINKDEFFIKTVKIRNKEERLDKHFKKSIFKGRVLKKFLQKVEKCFEQMPEEDRKILSVACGIINTLKNKAYPELEVKEDEDGLIIVSSKGEERFTQVVLSVLGHELHDVRTLFYKYLLGFKCEAEEYEGYRYYDFKIYPFVKSYIEKLASEVSKYVRIPDKQEIKSTLEELYRKGDLLKLAVIEWALSEQRKIEPDLRFILSFFYDIEPKRFKDEQFKELLNFENIIKKGFVNPLIYHHVREILKILYDEALKELINQFIETFKEAGYDYNCIKDNYYTFLKTSTKPINIYFIPWPKYISFGKEIPISIEAIVMQASQDSPSQRFLQYLEKYDKTKRLWLFIYKERRKIYVASNTYNEKLHKEFINILRNKFNIEFKPAFNKLQQGKEKTEPKLKRFGSRDILEDVVASALEALGFSVRVGYNVRSKAGTDIEVDVYGKKTVGGEEIEVYASCKNWDKSVNVKVVREEIGRVNGMRSKPYVKLYVILVAKSFTKSAKKEAAAHNFIVIELGEKVIEENALKALCKVHEILSKHFDP